MPRTDVFVAREDIAVAIDEGDVDGIGLKHVWTEEQRGNAMTSGRPLAATGRRPSMPRRRTTNDSATTNSAGVQPSLLSARA